MTRANVSSADYRALVARQATKAACPVKEGWADGALTIFVPGTPRHFKGKGHRYTVSKHTKNWRERTASRLLPYWFNEGRGRGFWPWLPELPKAITFTIYTAGRGFDPDNRRLICSPCLDALGMPRRYLRKGPDGKMREVGGHGVGLIDDDKNPAHAISYEQVTKATVPGIAITVALKGAE